jgi:D-3-phosphoglycerate dehydrogenase
MLSKIAILDPISVEAKQILTQKFGNSVYQATAIKEITDTEVLIIRSKTKVYESTAKHLKSLKLVVTSASGFDHIDLDWCKAKGIKVYNSSEAPVPSVCELTYFILIGLMRKIQEHKANMLAKGWREEVARGNNLNGKSIGIVGLGRIGQAVAKSANAFGMQVLACDPNQDESVFNKYNAERLGLTELIRQADIISLHVPYNKSTHEMINAASLQEVSTDAIIINTSRGNVVREADIIDLLRRQKIGGFGADVFKEEPLDTSSDLYTLPRVLITPHIGAYTTETFENACREAAQIVLDYFSGSLKKTELNP